MEPLMRDISQGVQSFVRNLGVYLTGKGIVTSGAIIAGYLAGAGSMPATLVVLGGGALISGYLRLRDMQFNQDEMTRIYRAEIADQLGIDPKTVTRAHLHTLAYGDEEKGIAANPVLRQEIDREWNKTWLKFGTTLVAATASFLLVMLGVPALAESSLLKPLGDTLGSWMSKASVALVTGVTGLVLNNGLDIGVQLATTLGKQTIHDRIARLEKDVTRGKQVTPEQVFAIFAASSPRLESSIIAQYGKRYDLLPIADQIHLIEAIGAKNSMTILTTAINTKSFSPGSLAFVVAGQRSLPINFSTVKDNGVDVPELGRARSPILAENTQPLASPMPDESIRATPGFIERVAGGARDARPTSFLERENQRRQTAMLDAQSIG